MVGSAPERGDHPASSGNDEWDEIEDIDDDTFTSVLVEQSSLLGIIGMIVVLGGGGWLLWTSLDNLVALSLTSYTSFVICLVAGLVYWVLSLVLLEVVVWTERVMTTASEDPIPENTVIVLEPSPTQRALLVVLFIAVAALFTTRTTQLAFDGREQLGILVGLWMVMLPFLGYMFVRQRRQYHAREVYATANLRDTMRAAENTDS